MSKSRDIPRRIARLLFIVGIFWALFLILPTLASIGLGFTNGSRPWLVATYLLCGFVVWGGWHWRSRQLRPLSRSLGLWLVSLVVNALFLVVLVVTDERWAQILIHDQMAFALWWWIFASVLSLVAFAFEFRLPRYETPAP
jgi:hypothetical protein